MSLTKTLGVLNFPLPALPAPSLEVSRLEQPGLMEGVTGRAWNEPIFQSPCSPHHSVIPRSHGSVVPWTGRSLWALWSRASRSPAGAFCPVLPEETEMTLDYRTRLVSPPESPQEHGGGRGQSSSMSAPATTTLRKPHHPELLKPGQIPFTSWRGCPAGGDAGDKARGAGHTSAPDGAQRDIPSAPSAQRLQSEERNALYLQIALGNERGFPAPAVAPGLAGPRARHGSALQQRR